MKLSFCTLGCPSWDIPAIVNNALLYGYDGVELRIGGDKHIDPEMDAGKRKEILGLFEKNNLEICCLGGYSLFWNADAEFLVAQSEILRRNVELAHDLRAPYVRTFMGAGLPEGDIPRQTEALHKCAEFAHEKGVTVLLEIHDSVKTGKQAREIVDNADSKGIGVLWDIHHSLTAGETPADTFNNLGDKLKHLHMKDAAGEKLTLMGEGTLEVAEIIKILVDNGFTGYASFEWEKMWVPELEDPEVAMPHYVKYMKNLIGR